MQDDFEGELHDEKKDDDKKDDNEGSDDADD